MVSDLVQLGHDLGNAFVAVLVRLARSLCLVVDRKRFLELVLIVRLLLGNAFAVKASACLSLYHYQRKKDINSCSRDMRLGVKGCAAVTQTILGRRRASWMGQGAWGTYLG